MENLPAFKCRRCAVLFQSNEVYTDWKINGKTHYICKPCKKLRVKKYRKTEKGKKNHLKNTNLYRQKFPERAKAGQIFRNFFKRSGEKRPETCSQCFLKIKVEAHHPDYSQPLHIIWVCSACHALLEKGKHGRKTKKGD